MIRRLYPSSVSREARATFSLTGEKDRTVSVSTREELIQ
jgi:hypothetical protein